MNGEKILEFDDLKVGSQFGRYTETVDEHLMGQWRALYPWDVSPPGEAPCSAAMPLIMRAYMGLLPTRPPGNIHAEQSLELLRPLKTNCPVTTTLSCVGKYLRNGRRFVEFSAEVTDEHDQMPLVFARLKLIWAR